MWWLVTISPSDETKPPDPPLLKRTDAFCACSSQASVRSKSYFFFSSDRGGSFSSHMPSSARTLATGVSTSQSRPSDSTTNSNRRCLTSAQPFEKTPKSQIRNPKEIRNHCPRLLIGGFFASYFRLLSDSSLVPKQSLGTRAKEKSMPRGSPHSKTHVMKRGAAASVKTIMKRPPSPV